MGYTLPTKKISDVATYIKRQFGDESGVQVTNDDVIRWVNAAEAEIISANQVLTAIATTSTVAAQEAYPLGASIDIQAINSIRVDGIKIPFMGFNEADEYINENDPTKSARAIPQFWYQWAGTVYLFPLPDKVYTLQIFYHRVPAALTALTDTLNLPDNYFNRIIEYCMAQAYELDENFEAASAKNSQFANGVQAMSLEDEGSAVDIYPMITIMPEDM